MAEITDRITKWQGNPQNWTYPTETLCFKKQPRESRFQFLVCGPHTIISDLGNCVL